MLVGSSILVSHRFSVEFDRRTVGIAVRVPGGFVFYASDERFEGMDGRIFRRARAIERELNRLSQRNPERIPSWKNPRFSSPLPSFNRS
jgi:hypothetical protein